MYSSLDGMHSVLTAVLILLLSFSLSWCFCSFWNGEEEEEEDLDLLDDDVVAASAVKLIVSKDNNSIRHNGNDINEKDAILAVVEVAVERRKGVVLQ